MTIAYDNMSTPSRSQQLFTKCCCCFPLRIGCFILGYISLLINTYHTILLVTITTFLGMYTNGFDHVDAEPVTSGYDDDGDQGTLFTTIGIILMAIIFINVLWLAINIALLVGLHKRRPGPVKVYIRFVSIRLMLSIISFMYMTSSGKVQTENIITYSLDLALAAYFLLVYYVYTQQLERENAQMMQRSESQINDTGFVYPTKMDKQHLVVA